MQSQTTTSPLPYFFIGKDLTSERIGNHAAKHTLLTDAIGKPDTRSVWYSKEHITQLLEEIEHVNGDGLRVFFGSYETSHQEFGDQTCLLMVVTREAQIGNTVIHQNVTVEDEPDFAERNALPRNIPSWMQESELFQRKKDYNHGSPCPPLCDGDDGIDFP